MRNVVNILGIPIDKITMNQAVDILIKSITRGERKYVCTPNSEILAMAQEDGELKTALREADMLIADGMGVVLASHIVGKPLPERVAGFDLMENLLEKSNEMNLKIFLFGAAPGVAEQAKINIVNTYPNIRIAGVENGYGYKENEEAIIEKINYEEPDILFVALGAPRQEKWLHDNSWRLKAAVSIGVGGSFDILAGKKTRAPKTMQKLGLEWLYRLIKEPSRYKRTMEIPKFIGMVLKNKGNQDA